MLLLLLLQVCNDVQVMKYDTQCQMVTNMKTKCDIIMNQQCNKVNYGHSFTPCHTTQPQVLAAVSTRLQYSATTSDTHS
jgi:hypothetical protein